MDTNLYDSALAMLSYPATWFLSSGFVTERQPMSGHPTVVPFQFFATADGHIAIATPKEKFFRALVDGMGLPELVDDRRSSDFEARGLHREFVAAESSREVRGAFDDGLADGPARTDTDRARALAAGSAGHQRAASSRDVGGDTDHRQFGPSAASGFPWTMAATAHLPARTAPGLEIEGGTWLTRYDDTRSAPTRRQRGIRRWDRLRPPGRRARMIQEPSNVSTS